MIIAGLFRLHTNDHSFLIENLYDSLKQSNPAVERLRRNNFDLVVSGKGCQFESNYSNTVVVGVGNLFSAKSYKPITGHEFKIMNIENTFEDIPELLWGDYVLVSACESSIKIIRPAVSNITIFYHKFYNGDVAFANEISYLYRLITSKVSFSEHYLLRYLIAFNTHQLINTAFNDIYELPSGFMLSSSETLKLSKIWHHSYKSDNWKGEVEQLPEKLISILKCLSDASDSKLILELSGGIDSSAIFMALSQFYKHDMSIDALHIYYPNLHSADERQHARQLIRGRNVRLTEINFGEFLPFSQVDYQNFLPNKPDSSLIKLKMEKYIIESFVKNNSCKFISGEGGDYIFNCMPDTESIADLVITNNLGILFDKIKEIAMQRSLPLTVIMFRVMNFIRQYLFKQNYFAFDPSSSISWLHKDLQFYNNTNHPFYTKLLKDGMIPGTALLNDSLNMALHIISSHPRKNHTYYPLLSNPIVEIDFLIPSYL